MVVTWAVSLVSSGLGPLLPLTAYLGALELQKIGRASNYVYILEQSLLLYSAASVWMVAVDRSWSRVLRQNIGAMSLVPLLRYAVRKKPSCVKFSAGVAQP